MKKIFLLLLTTSALLFSTPVLSHHAAEGIISDDIWDMIDGLLLDTSSPHLEIELDIGTDAIGRTAIVSSFIVETEDVDDVLAALYAGLATLTRGGSSVLVGEPVDLEDGTTRIDVYEAIGSGQRQVIPANSD